MNIFKLHKEKLSVDKDKLHHPDFQPLLNLEKTDKKSFMQAMLYLFYCNDLSKDNPLSSLAYDEIHVEAANLVFGDGWESSVGITTPIETLGKEWLGPYNRAVKCYKKNFVSDQEREIHTFDKKLDQLRAMLSATVPEIIKNTNEDSEEVSFVSNIDIINKSLSSIIDIIQTKSQLISIYAGGGLHKSLRGGLSPISAGKLKTSMK